MDMSKLVKWCALVLSILTFTLVIAERLGALDWYLDLKPMQKVAENLSSSYMLPCNGYTRRLIANGGRRFA